jgi:parvulin-like peptidyl-prolyl isomerase
MLDVMRKHSRSFIIYIFFGIIIAVFVVNFGPQSAGCTATTSHAGRVEGKSISQVLFNYAMTVSGIRNQNVPEAQMIQLRGIVMDHLIVRELLADDALDLGFRIPDKEIDDMIVKGRFLALGQPHPLVRNDEGKFDYELLSRYVRFSWGLNIPKFKEQQRRELLADKFRQYLRSLVKVSEDEVQSDYLVKNTQVSLEYVRFSPSDTRSRVELDETKVAAWLAANKKKVEDYYKDNKTAYQKLPKQVRLQVLSFTFADAASKTAARRKADTALQRLKKGEAFATLAKESDDAETRAAGGLVGWRNEDSPAIDPAAAKAVPKAKKGELSGVIEGQERLTIVKVLDRRQGDLTLEQAQQEIAEDLYRNEQSVSIARAEAESFLRRAKAGEKLADMFTADETKPEDDVEKKDEEKKDDAKKDEEKKDEAKGPRSPLKLTATALFSRSGRYLVPGVGISEELTAAAFKMKKGEVGSKPYVVGQMVYLVACKDRKDPDLAEWAKRKDDLMEDAAVQKWSRQVRDYAYARCQSALQKKSLQINSRVMVSPGYVPDKKEGALPSYTPCSSLAERAGS